MLITKIIFEDAPWRHFAGIQVQGFLESFMKRVGYRPIYASCFTVHTPGTSISKALPPIRRALREFYGTMKCFHDVGVRFYLYGLPKLDKSDSGGRFRLLLFLECAASPSVARMCEYLKSRLEKKLTTGPVFVTNHEAPTAYRNGAMKVVLSNYFDALKWFYHYLTDATVIYSPKKIYQRDVYSPFKPPTTKRRFHNVKQF